MFQFIHFSDTHLGDHLPKYLPKDLRMYRGYDFLKSYLKVIDYINKHIKEIDFIIHTGDFFDSNVVPLYLRKIVLNSLENIGRYRIPFIIVLGNHEKEVFPEEITNKFSNIHIIKESETKIINIKGEKISITGIPYIRSREGNLRKNFEKELKKARFYELESDFKILLFHQIVEGARVGVENFRFPPLKIAVPLKSIPKADYIGVGHIHKSQIVRDPEKKIYFPGSTERITFSEVGEKKKFFHVYVDKNRHVNIKEIPIKSRNMFEYLIKFDDNNLYTAKQKIDKILNKISRDSYGRVKFEGILNYHIFNEIGIERIKQKTFISHFLFKKLHLTSEDNIIFLMRKNTMKGLDFCVIKSQLTHNKIKNLPSEQGIFILLDKKDNPLYIGKSKSIRKRIKELFSEATKSEKIKEMLEKAADVEFYLFNNKLLLLMEENLLIKKYNPPYNKQNQIISIKARYIGIKREKGFPYLELLNDKDSYEKRLGPLMINEKMEKNFIIFTHILRFPNCKGKYILPISHCYQYLLNQCMMPCKSDQAFNEYVKKINEFIDFPLKYLKEIKVDKLDENEKEILQYYTEKIELIDKIKNMTGILMVNHENKSYAILIKNGIILNSKIYENKNDLIKIKEEFKLEIKKNSTIKYNFESLDNYMFIFNFIEEGGKFESFIE